MNASDSSPATTPMARTKWIAAFIVLLLAAGFAGYQQIFSTFAEYDDEGYVMLSLLSFSEGRPLYDETYTQYGPAFFCLQSAFHQVSGLPISHDVTRLKTLGVWLFAALLAGLFIRRETGSWPLATGAFLIAFFHLERLCLEPGHPQEFCVLGILAALVLGSFWKENRSGDDRKSTAGVALALGVLVSILVMTKLNVGVFVGLAITLTMLLRGPRGFLATALLSLTAAAAVALPFLLTLSHLRDLTGFALPILCACSLGATVWVASRDRKVTRAEFGWTEIGWFVVATIVGTLLFGTLALQHGTTPQGLLYGLVGQHLGFKKSFYTPAPLHAAVVLWCAVAIDAAFASAKRPRMIGMLRLAAAGALVFAALQYLPETHRPLIHGLNDRGGAALLIGAAGPVLWILLRPGVSLDTKTNGEAAGTASIGRLMLCLVAALQPLGAYPTPGTQMAVGSIAIALGCLLALQDVLRLENSWLPRAHLAAPGIVLLLACTLLVRDAHLLNYRRSLTPLGLQGASLLRMPSDQAHEHRWLANLLKDQTDTFVFGEHSRNSLYFWSGRRPPTSLNPTFWPFLLREQEQRRIIEVLEQTPRAAVVHAPFAAELPTDSLLLNYLEKHFEFAASKGDFEVWLRRTGE